MASLKGDILVDERKSAVGRAGRRVPRAGEIANEKPNQGKAQKPHVVHWGFLRNETLKQKNL